MAEFTTSLQAMRRLVCQELKMPFFVRYKNGFLDADSGSTITLVDTALTQGDKFWNRMWVYRVATQEASLITNFTARDDTCVLEVPVTAFASGDDYEIQTLWNAFEINSAINQAIRDARRIFFETVTDETIVIQEDVLAYSIASLAKTPFGISRVWIEQPTSAKRGVLVSATSTTAVVENSGVLTGVDSNYKISIYAGTGKGQIRSVVSVASATVTVAAWTTTPDSTSKYALWNPATQIYDWYPFDAVRYDSSKEFPDILYITRRNAEFYGLRMRLEYVSLPVELSAEADTTVIPSGYLLPAVLSILHSQKIQDTKVDRDLHFGESRRFKEMANEYMVRNAPHRPDMAILRHPNMHYQPDMNDPLGWQG